LIVVKGSSSGSDSKTLVGEGLGGTSWLFVSIFEVDLGLIVVKGSSSGSTFVLDLVREGLGGTS
jgi:hypothetical protein